jgi:hypothetical protein
MKEIPVQVKHLLLSHKVNNPSNKVLNRSSS